MPTSVSEERLERNQANAQHSTGPKTEAGKRKSRLNALRHGLTSNLVVLPSENQEDYDEHLQSFINEYRPQDATESHLVQVLADTAWRQIRVTSLEADLLMFSPTTFVDFESQAKALGGLSLHGQRLSREFERVANHLRQIQKARQAKEKSESGFVFTEPPARKVSAAKAGHLSDLPCGFVPANALEPLGQQPKITPEASSELGILR